MKKVLSLFLVVCMCIGLMGCGGEKGGDFALDKPYEIETDRGTYTITVTGVSRSDWASTYSNDLAKSNEVVLINFKVGDIKPNKEGDLIEYDFNIFRVHDEKGEEIASWDYHFDKDKFPGVFASGDEGEYCEGYLVNKGARYIEIEIYQNTEFSNKIKVDIK